MTEENELDDVAQQYEDFIKFKEEKVFDSESPMPFTNSIVIRAMRAEVQAGDAGVAYDARSFLGKAVEMHATDYPKYRKYMEIAGFKYVERI